MEKLHTIAEIAEANERKPDTLWRKAKRDWPDRKWSIHSVVTDEEAAALLSGFSADAEALHGDFAAVVGDLERAKKKVIRTTHTTKTTSGEKPAVAKVPKQTPSAPRWKWPTFYQVRAGLFSILAIAIVAGHGFMIWQEAAELYGYIGNIGGVVIFAVVCLALLVSSDSTRTRTSESALWFMFLVDVAAGFVHFEALRTPTVPNAMTVGFCVFICACSFVALFLYRDSKLD